jgi:hypothetical protein
MDHKFFQVVDDPKDFQILGVNLAKLFYDIYCSDEISKLSPSFSQEILNRRRRALLSILLFIPAIIHLLWLAFSSRRHPKILFYEGAIRTIISNGVLYDQYNSKIIDSKGRHNFILLQEAEQSRKRMYHSDIYIIFFRWIIFLIAKVFWWIHRKEVTVFASKLTHKCSSFNWTTDRIVFKTNQFFGEYIFFRFLIKLLRPKGIILICHYSKESFIAACHSLKHPVTEIQHGHILRNHPFYNIPDFNEEFRTAFTTLLPDYLGVYGKFWKENLIEGKQFHVSSIFILGYYLKQPDTVKKQREGKTIILITTQPHVQRSIIEYVKFLSQVLSPKEWQVIIKPHSAEDTAPYENLAIHDFIIVSTTSVYTLLQLCDIHISVFSTVLFEALMFPVVNYSLYVEEVRVQCEEITSSRVALRLNSNEIPDPAKKPPMGSSHFFSPCDLSALFLTLN